MNIIEQNKEKVNGVLKTFDRMIINGYILQLCNYRQFQYYLIENNIGLKDFNKFAVEQTELLCEHIEKYAKTNKVEVEYLTCGKTDKTDKTDKQELAYNSYLNDTTKNGLIAAYSVVEMCNVMTVKANRETKKLEIASKPTKCKHYYLYYNDINSASLGVRTDVFQNTDMVCIQCADIYKRQGVSVETHGQEEDKV